MRRSPSPKVAKLRARIAGTRSNHPDADVTDLRRELKYAKAEDFLQKILGEAPPLNQAQRADLAALLVGGDA